MKVLIACEESQRVCIAFRERGHEAYSCDILEPSGCHPEWHIMGDCIPLLKGGTFTTMDKKSHTVNRWDLIIAHPPCTYLSNVATRSFSLKCTPPEKIIKRWEERAKSAVFFMQFVSANSYRICIENPVGFMNSAYRGADQIIHPYMFSSGSDDTENFVTKRTCLWLKNLPLLVPTYNGEKPDNAKLYGTYPSGKAACWEDTIVSDPKSRSKTFPGIANAMAEQWG